MLRSSATPSDELQEEEMRAFKPAEAEEEDQVVVCHGMGAWAGRGECCGRDEETGRVEWETGIVGERR